MARKLYVTAPDGTVLKRQTENEYAFAVCVFNHHYNVWTAPHWSGSHGGADKLAAPYRNRGITVSLQPVRDTA